jgi:Putative adhesin
MQRKMAAASGVGASLVLLAACAGASARAAKNVPVAPGAAAQNADDFRWSGQIARGKSVEIKGINGDIDAGRAQGNQVEVVAHKHARRSDPAEVRIDIVEHEGSVTVCAVYPTPLRTSSGHRGRGVNGEGQNVCQQGDGGRMNVRDNDVVVDFTVRVPEGVRLIARTVNGGIGAASLRSDLEAYTVNGRIKLSTTGVASAETVNGSIEASLGAATWNEPMDFRTVNGSITIDLPAGAAAELRAETLNGGITSDFPITTRTLRRGGRRIVGTIGSGGKELHVATTNGGIRLRSAAGR